MGNADICTEALLFNTGPSCAALDFGGGGDVDLTPPLSGDYEGTTIWQDSACTEAMTMRGNADVLSGVI